VENQTLKGPDTERSYLRSAVRSVDYEMSHLKQVRAGTNDAATDRLVGNWDDLVDLLELGPEPEYRACPFCGSIGMRAANLCGYCWRKLQPFVSQPEA